MIHGLAEGRVVRYVLAKEDVDPVWVAKHPIPEGRSVVAMIVKVIDQELGIVNLTILPDWSNDGFVSRASAIPQPMGIAWRQHVGHSEAHESGTWHFPPKV